MAFMAAKPVTVYEFETVLWARGDKVAVRYIAVSAIYIEPTTQISLIALITLKNFYYHYSTIISIKRLHNVNVQSISAIPL